MAYIYKITNTINGKLYIGQTVKSIEVRFKEHLHKAKDTNYKLYKAMRKYGTDNFIIEVLQECSKEQLNELEIYWIDKLDTIKNGYNLTKGGQHTSVSIYKKVRKYTTDFQYVQTYESIAEAARDLGLNPSTILDCLKHRRRAITAGGFIWCYDDDIDAIEKIENKTYFFENKCIKKVKQYSLDGEFIKEFKGMRAAAREFNISYVTISACVNHRARAISAGGYQWCFEGDEGSIKKLPKIRSGVKQKVLAVKDGEEIIFDSVKEASKALHIKPISVHHLCNGRNKQTKTGYKLSYIQ